MDLIDTQRIVGETLQIVGEMLDESDRGCVLVAHSCLDEQLEDLIKTFLRRSSQGDEAKGVIDNLLGVGRPLGTFLVRAKMAVALGLISGASLKALVELNDIRNDFAHRRPPPLSDERVNRVLDRMQSFEKTAVDTLVKGVEGNKLFFRLSAPRVRFMCIAGVLLWVLQFEADAEKPGKTPPTAVVSTQIHATPPHRLGMP